MRFLRSSVVVVVMGVVGTIGCATAPKSAEERSDLEARAAQTLKTMQDRDPQLGVLLQNAPAYAVFPSIGKAGLVVGGAHGRGVLYEGGRMTGYVQLNEASIGAQAGGQSFAELIVFKDPGMAQKLKGGNFELSGNASAVALTAGAAASAQFIDGSAVFVMPLGGAMAELSVGGQQIKYVPRG